MSDKMPKLDIGDASIVGGWVRELAGGLGRDDNAK